MPLEIKGWEQLVERPYKICFKGTILPCTYVRKYEDRSKDALAYCVEFGDLKKYNTVIAVELTHNHKITVKVYNKAGKAGNKIHKVTHTLTESTLKDPITLILYILRLANNA